MNEIKNNIQQNELHSKDEDEIIINFDEFGTISDLEEELFSSLKNETSKKLNINNKNNISREHKIKKISPMAYSLTNKTFCQSNLISKETTLLSKDNSNSVIRKKQQRVKSPVKKIILNGGNDGCSHHSNQKSIFSKISEILYNSYNDEISQHKSSLNYKNSQEDNYNQMTSDQYLYNLADKQNNHIKNSLITEKMENKKYQKMLNDNHYSGDKNEELFSINKYYRRKIRTPEEFLEDQIKYLDKHNKHIEKMISEQNKKIQNFFKDKPSISNDSRKLANNLRKTGDKNIFNKLYNDFSLREKKREEILKKRYDNNNSGMNRTLSKVMIKQNSERLYKEYLKKKSFLSESKNKQNKYFQNMVLTKFANKTSNNILYHKFLKNYKNILNSQFNMTVEDNFEINFHDYLKIIKELGVINDDYISLFKNEEEKSHKNLMKELSLQNFANIWKGNNNIDDNMINLNRSTNFKILGNNRKSITKNNEYKNNAEYKLIKDSWKIITKNREFSLEQYGNTQRLLYFLLSLLGIYDGNLNNTFIKNELPFLLEKNKNIIDKNLSKQIFKFFYNFRKSIFENLIYKKNSNNFGKISIPNYNNLNRKSKRLRNANSNQNRYIKTINNVCHQKRIKNKRIKKDNFNTVINNKDNSIPKKSILNYYDFEENKISSKNELNKMKKFINSTIKNENEDQIKKIKFVFQIKIEGEPKKLIIYEKEDKMKKIEEFCEMYNLDSYEKQQIINAVKQKFEKI